MWTTDVNFTGTESPEQYSDSKYYSPGQDQSPQPRNHLIEEEEKAEFDRKDRCPGQCKASKHNLLNFYNLTIKCFRIANDEGKIQWIEVMNSCLNPKDVLYLDIKKNLRCDKC